MKFNNKLKLLSVFCIFSAFTSLSASAVIKKGALHCDGCSTYQIKALATKSAGSNDAIYLMYNRDSAKIYEMTVDAPTFTGGSEDEEAKSIVKMSLNLEASEAYEELILISDEIAKQAQVEIEPDHDFPFDSVYESMLSGATLADFERALEVAFAAGLNPNLNEVARRADNQIDNLNSSLGVSWKALGFGIGSVVKDSSWVVIFKDGTKIVVDITFKTISDKTVPSVKSDTKKAIDREGNSIPLSIFSVNGEVTGESPSYIEAMANYYESLGAYIGRFDESDGWLEDGYCTSNGLVCTTDDGCKVHYVCSD